MHSSSLFHIELIFLLILIAAMVAIVVKWVRLPYSIALVLVGLLIGLFGIVPSITLTPELILVVFLPALLFEASWNLDFKHLRQNWSIIGALAVFGVIVTMLAVGYSLHYIAGLALPVAFLLGAVVASTDPISVLALFRKLGMHKGLTVLLEGESLFNDATAVILFRLTLLAAISSTQVSLFTFCSDFIFAVLGGVFVGCIVGFGASRCTSYFEDHLLELTLTVLVAYGSYLLAEQLHVSAVLAVVVAGMIMGNYGRKIGMSSSTRLSVQSFWEYAAFLVDSIVFLLIGMQINLDALITHAGLIALVLASMYLARALFVYAFLPIISSNLPFNWRHLLFWGGVRGSLCIAMVLSLPVDLPEREMFSVVAFGVVFFTLIVQGLTIGPLSSKLKGLKSQSQLNLYQALVSELKTDRRKLARAKLDYDARRIQRKEYRALQDELEQEIERLEKRLISLRSGDLDIRRYEEIYLDRNLLNSQKDELRRMEKEALVSSTLLEARMMRINDELASLVELADLGRGENAEQMDLLPADPASSVSGEDNSSENVD